jgi:hypothetical protein
MADTETIVPETGGQQPLVTPAQTTNSEVEALKKQLAQAEMEKNLLRNQKDALAKEKEELTKQELEQKEQYRELYEKEKAERENLLKERQDSEFKTQIEAAQKETLAKFPANVVDIATTTGLALADTTEDAKKSYEGKLEAIAAKVGTTQKVQGNNAPQNTETAPERELLLKGMKFGDADSRRKAINGLSAIAEMKRNAGISE